jgi:hypothetical protein
MIRRFLADGTQRRRRGATAEGAPTNARRRDRDDQGRGGSDPQAYLGASRRKQTSSHRSRSPSSPSKRSDHSALNVYAHELHGAQAEAMERLDRRMRGTDGNRMATAAGEKAKKP